MKQAVKIPVASTKPAEPEKSQDMLEQMLPPRVLIQQFCLFLGGIVCVLMLAYIFVPDAKDLEQNVIKQYVVEQGWQGIALFVLLGIVFITVAGARQVVAAISGHVFGFAWGFAWGLVITFCACCLLFAGARCVRLLWIGTSPLYTLNNKYFAIVQKAFVQKPFLGTVVFRLLPLGSNYIFTLFAGWCTIRTKPFLAGSFIGYIPQVLIFSLIGSGIGQAWWNIAGACVLFVISIGLGIFLYKRVTQ